MPCLVCETFLAPPETGLCEACDFGFHPIRGGLWFVRTFFPECQITAMGIRVHGFFGKSSS